MAPAQKMILPHAFSTMTVKDPSWNMDTSASSHLTSHTRTLCNTLNKRLYPSVRVGDGTNILVTNTGHSILPTLNCPLHLHNVLVTLNIIKNLICVCQFTRDNKCTVEFDEFGFSVKDFLTRHILLRCDRSCDLYPVTKSSYTPSALLSISPTTWHQRLGHPGDEVLQSLVSYNYISCNKAKSSRICHACHLDISYAIQQVCLYMHDPREPHLEALKRILRYVHSTLGFGLQPYASSTTSLIAYSDVDWAARPVTRRSTSGYYVFLGNNLVSWSSKRQHTLSRSSAEVEYRCVANAVTKTAWLRNLLIELHTPLLTTTLVYCDNVSAIYMSANPVQHQRMKHIEIDIHFVRDMVSKGQ
nr:ribonuclease H-like domain-containing protein [Tanacetum cinerariifolium]